MNTKNKRAILVVCFLLTTKLIFGQDTNKREKDYTKPNLNFSFGVLLQSKIWGEVGINYGTIHQFVHGPYGKTLLGRLSTEFTFIDNELLLAPKVGLQKSVGLLDIRASFVRYAKSNITDFRFDPEVVLEGQKSSLAFGLNIPLSSTTLDYVSKMKFSILLNF